MSYTQTRSTSSTTSSTSSSRPSPGIVAIASSYLWSAVDALSLFVNSFINPDSLNGGGNTGLANRSNIRGVSGSLTSRAGGNTTGGSGSGGSGGGRVAGMGNIRPAMNCGPSGG